MPDRPLKLGSRRSPLAMAQAEEARDRLQAAHPGIAVEIVPVTASGDRVLGSLADAGGKALWTKELDAWLMAGTIDFAVHSAKDVETIRPAGIAIAAVLPREDVRDVLVGVASLAELRPGALIGTSAPRRAALVLHARPDCRVITFRGNIQTRLAKLAAGEADATLLALAGLNRTGQGSVGTPLDPEIWLPAPGQGAIAIECRSDDGETFAILSAIDDRTSNEALHAERRLLAALGGNCHSPVAVLSGREGNTITMRAALFSPDGRDRVDGARSFAAEDAAGPAALAADLLARAVPSIREHFVGSQGD
ncbi:hydroxymethylbilane synthase [Novosphingobium sp.]|uniref:hydroxymethylbilane synthase n=1 Tax=Novosphingobium sp. TaxID=1874826 RepID=UPI0025D4C896|nr:hydroxymethylbilane synthase [Novosphingobium sp.]